jgi:hypothetical protein
MRKEWFAVVVGLVKVALHAEYIREGKARSFVKKAAEYLAFAHVGEKPQDWGVAKKLSEILPASQPGIGGDVLFGPLVVDDQRVEIIASPRWARLVCEALELRVEFGGEPVISWHKRYLRLPEAKDYAMLWKLASVAEFVTVHEFGFVPQGVRDEVVEILYPA